MSAGAARRSTRLRGGQNMVEFALVAPMLLVLIFGIIDVSSYFIDRDGVSDAARAGARYAATWPGVTAADYSKIAAAVQSAGYPPIPLADITITYWLIGASTTGTKCGSLTAAGFAPFGSYTAATCETAPSTSAVSPTGGGTMIEVSVSYTYSAPAPIPLPTAATVFTESTEVLEEQAAP